MGHQPLAHPEHWRSKFVDFFFAVGAVWLQKPHVLEPSSNHLDDCHRHFHLLPLSQSREVLGRWRGWFILTDNSLLRNSFLPGTHRNGVPAPHTSLRAHRLR